MAGEDATEEQTGAGEGGFKKLEEDEVDEMEEKARVSWKI